MQSHCFANLNLLLFLKFSLTLLLSLLELPITALITVNPLSIGVKKTTTSSYCTFS